ncbi:MAG: hypothetical protein JXB05_15225 [Myxococcaceae bacterium]|nr:hypothetical protein [Myxococcaceae bacterium]
MPLVGAVVLAVAVLGVALWPAAPAPPAPVEVPRPPAVSLASGATAPQATRPPPRPPAPATEPVSSPPAPAPEETPRATVVPIGPEDEVPEPESDERVPQQNDPILPEKPQTARWRLGKTERIASLLVRDVERMEREREAARTRGDEGEQQRLDILLRRHQDRLVKMREEIQQLSLQAAHEPPEE